MTREVVAEKIGWRHIIWFVGLVNVTAMLPQLYSIIVTRNVEGLSLEMFLIYFAIQVCFSLEGFFTRNRMLMVCLGLSALVSAIVITLVIYLRYFA